jgi:hypothetical protein
MKLYLVSQDVCGGYDSYDSMVVAARSPEEAIRISPCGTRVWSEVCSCWTYSDGREARRYGDWPNNLIGIRAELIGSAVKGTKAGLILASFNAG